MPPTATLQAAATRYFDALADGDFATVTGMFAEPHRTPQQTCCSRGPIVSPGLAGHARLVLLGDCRSRSGAHRREGPTRVVVGAG